MGDDDRIDPSARVQSLHAAIRQSLPTLQALLDEVNRYRIYEDGVYRFYHRSFKVYRLQESTQKMVEALQALAPDRGLDDWFRAIVAEGTGKEFRYEHNDRWLEETRPIVEAFFHARYFLEMAVKYGTELEYPPQLMPSGWAAVLSLYGLR